MQNYHVKEDPRSRLNIWIEPTGLYQSTIQRVIRKLTHLKLSPLIKSSKAQNRGMVVEDVCDKRRV